jgi:hypothetical protein
LSFEWFNNILARPSQVSRFVDKALLETSTVIVKKREAFPLLSLVHTKNFKGYFTQRNCKLGTKRLRTGIFVHELSET